jgi:hypothetical protein
MGRKMFNNEKGIKVFDPMEDVLTQITDPNIVMETITSQSSYLETRKSIDHVPFSSIKNISNAYYSNVLTLCQLCSMLYLV